MARRGHPQRGEYSIRTRERCSQKRAVRERRDNRDLRAARYVREALRPRADDGGEPDSFSSAHVEVNVPYARIASYNAASMRLWDEETFERQN